MSSSGRVRVLIGTSEGPVEILCLRREGQAVRRSRVTLGGSVNDAGVSRGYDTFVAGRTGIIQRLFDDSRAYRAEVSAKIDAGSSWQLAFFVAHALLASDRLAAAGHARNTTLWATGTVRTDDLSVGEIGYLARKLSASLATLNDAAAAGERVIVAFPVGNANEPGLALRQTLLATGVEIIEAQTVVDVVRKLDLPAIALAADAVAKPWTGSPFPGLEAFQPQHRDVFFGRDKAREEMLERVRNAAKGEFAFLLIHGRSGSGKSSLVRAGLLGDVAIQAAEADVWRNSILSPGLSGTDPLAGLITALANALPEVSASLSGAPDSLAAAVRQGLASAVPGKTCKLLLVVDQLEELLLGDSVERREVFAEAIAALAASGAVWVVATLRSDLLSRIKDSPALSRLCSDDRMYWLDRPTRTELRDIIRRPAASARLRLEGCDPSGQPLVEVLIDAAAASPDSLPLLQFVLARMFAVDGANGNLTFATYVDLGRLEGAVGQWAEHTAQDLIASGVTESVIDQVILGLGRFERETGAVVARLGDADSATHDRQRVLEAFRRARLITLDDNGRARVAHEAVLTHWIRAKSLFTANAHEVELRDLLEAEAARWEQEHRAAEFLIAAGLRVAEAQLLVNGGRVAVSPLARAFVNASIASARNVAAEETRRQKRLARRAIAAAIVMGVLALSAGVLGWMEREQAHLKEHALQQEKEATAKEKKAKDDAILATQRADDQTKVAIRERNSALSGRARLFAAVASQYNQNDDFGTGLSVALEGISELQTFDVPVPGQLQRELFIAQNELRERQTFHGKQGFDAAPALSPDGKLLAGCTADEFVVWDVSSKRRIGAAPSSETMGFCNAAFSPDGTKVVFAEFFKIHEFDVTLATKKFEVPNHNGVSSVAFTPNGAYLVAFQQGETAFLDPSTGQLLWSTPSRPPKDISQVLSKRGALSQDSRFMIRAVGSSVEIWDIAAKTKVNSLHSPDPILAVAISPDNVHVVTASEGGVARVWDLGTKGQVFSLVGHKAGITCAAYSPDGSLILTCSKDGTGKLWNAQSGTLVATLRGRNAPAASMNSGSFSKQGRLVITSDMFGDLIFWAASPVMAAADWTTKGAPFASLDGNDHVIPIYHSDLKLVPTRLDQEKRWVDNGHSTIALRDARTGAGVAVAPFIATGVHQMQVCQHDNRVLIASGKGLQVRDATMAKVEVEVQKDREVYQASFSPDCGRFVSAALINGVETIGVFSSADGGELTHRTLPSGLVGSLQFSGDGRSVVAGIDDAIVIMSADDLKEFKRIERHRGQVLFAVPSPDGRLLVSSSDHGEVFIWYKDTDTFVELDARLEKINSARFSDDGNRLVTTSADGVATIWDTATLEQIGQVRHSAVVTGAVFTKDGRRLLTVTPEGEVRITELYQDLAELVAHSQMLSVRDLGLVEKAQIFSLIPKNARETPQ